MCIFLRPKMVYAMVGMSRSTIWRMERQGLFPGRVSLGARCVGYIASEISEWVATRARVSQTAPLAHWEADFMESLVARYSPSSGIAPQKSDDLGNSRPIRVT